MGRNKDQPAAASPTVSGNVHLLAFFCVLLCALRFTIYILFVFENYTVTRSVHMSSVQILSIGPFLDMETSVAFYHPYMIYTCPSIGYGHGNSC
jgi:hypothetical protein